MKVGIIVAMDKELQQLRKLFHDDNVVVEKCGIGKVNAAIGTAEMIRQHKPDAIISSGCAGGHGHHLKVQDVVASSELVYHDVYCGRAIDDSTVYGQVQGMPARFKADPYLLQKVAEVANSPLFTLHSSLQSGLFVTGDWFVDSKEKMREIVGHFPDALAVDMESCAIAQTCYTYNVPFISFRVISDMPLEDTDASQYHDFWSQVADRSFQVTKTYVQTLLQGDKVTR